MKKPGCEKHKTFVEGFDGTMEELAEKLGDLRYDTLVEFLDHFSKKIEKDGEKDKAGGRVKLANSLLDASLRIGFASEAIKKSWIHSKPYMKL